MPAKTPDEQRDVSREVAQEFVDAWKLGDVVHIRTMLGEKAPVEGPQLDPDFYAAVKETAKDIRLGRTVPAVGHRGANDAVEISYSLAGRSDLKLTLWLKKKRGKATVVGWSNFLPFYAEDAPVGFRVNGKVWFTRDPEPTAAGYGVGKVTQMNPRFYLLPGVYSITYEDPMGLGTTNLDGTPAAPFELALPFQPEGQTLPADMNVVGNSIYVEPRLTTAAETSAIQDATRQMQQCASTNFADADCPGARQLTDVVPGSASVKLANSSFDAHPRGEWTGRMNFTVHYRQASSGVERDVNLAFAGAVTRVDAAKVAFFIKQ